VIHAEDSPPEPAPALYAHLLDRVQQRAPAGTGRLPAAQIISGGDARFLGVSYTRDKKVSDVVAQPQATSDSMNWSTGVCCVIQQVVDLGRWNTSWFVTRHPLAPIPPASFAFPWQPVD
jgi:hypothetical protein